MHRRGVESKTWWVTSKLGREGRMVEAGRRQLILAAIHPHSPLRCVPNDQGSFGIHLTRAICPYPANNRVLGGGVALPGRSAIAAASLEHDHFRPNTSGDQRARHHLGETRSTRCEASPDRFAPCLLGGGFPGQEPHRRQRKDSCDARGNPRPGFCVSSCG